MRIGWFLKLKEDGQYLKAEIQQIAFALQRPNEKVKHNLFEWFFELRIGRYQVESYISNGLKNKLHWAEIIVSSSFEELFDNFRLVLIKLAIGLFQCLRDVVEHFGQVLLNSLLLLYPLVYHVEHVHCYLFGVISSEEICEISVVIEISMPHYNKAIDCQIGDLCDWSIFSPDRGQKFDKRDDLFIGKEDPEIEQKSDDGDYVYPVELIFDHLPFVLIDPIHHFIQFLLDYLLVGVCYDILVDVELGAAVDISESFATTIDDQVQETAFFKDISFNVLEILNLVLQEGREQIVEMPANDPEKVQSSWSSCVNLSVSEVVVDVQLNLIIE